MEHTHSADIDKKGNPSVGTATMGIKAPCDHDVLFGRGGGTNHRKLLHVCLALSCLAQRHVSERASERP